MKKMRFVKSKGLYLRNNVWWMTFKGADGKQHWESCHTASKTDALTLLEQRRVAARKGELPEIKRIKPVLLSELAKEYGVWVEKQKGFKSKKSSIKRLLAQFGSLTHSLPTKNSGS